MSNSDRVSIDGYNPPERERVDCDRCGDVEVLVFVDRTEPALCDDCEEYIDSLEVPEGPEDEREITPMDKRWR